MWNTTLFVGDWGRQAIISYDTATDTERTIMSDIMAVGLLYSIRSRHITGKVKRDVLISACNGYSILCGK